MNVLDFRTLPQFPLLMWNQMLVTFKGYEFINPIELNSKEGDKQCYYKSNGMLTKMH